MQLTEHLFSQCQNEDGNRTDWLGIQFTGIKLTYSSVSANIIIAVCDNLPSLWTHPQHHTHTPPQEKKQRNKKPAKPRYKVLNLAHFFWEVAAVAMIEWSDKN